METEQCSQLIASRRILASLINRFDFNKRILDERLLKELKIILKNNPDVIEPLFGDFLKYLKWKNCAHRFGIVLLFAELFERSHIFRVQMLIHLQDILRYTAETDPFHCSLPPPREAANVLKFEMLKLVKNWHEKYAIAYPMLEFAVRFLRNSRSFDFERMDVQLRIERQRAEETERKRNEKSTVIVQKVNSELTERQDDIFRCISETRQAIELLVPRFEIDKNDARIQPTCSDKAIHAYTALESITITVPLNAPLVNVNDENRALISAVLDCMKMLQFYEKLARRWLSKLAKYGGRNAQNLCKKIIDLKGKIMVELERCKELHLPTKKRKGDGDDSESDDDNDLEDVPEKEGLELDFKPPDEVPEYILKKTMEDSKSDLPGPSGINKMKKEQSNDKKRGNDGNEVPVLSFGLDLKYWGEDNIQPAEVPRNNADCHRFWRPSDESCTTSHDTAEAYHSRVMTFVGEELKGSRQCRAPLTDGTLCPRMDLKRCPLHGKIIDRDEMGYPMVEIKQQKQQQKSDSSTGIDRKDDEEYLKNVEAATGANLTGKPRRRKRKRHDESESNEPSAVRERLSAKLFNRNTMKRVYETLDSIRKARAAKNFEHQFNYALMRR